MKLKTLIFILTALCLFRVTVYGSQDVIVNLNIHKITINCNTNAKIIYNGQVYENSHEFFLLSGSDFTVEIASDETKKVDTIICNENCNMSFNNNYLTINNVSKDISIEVILTEEKDIIQLLEELLENLSTNTSVNVEKNDIYYAEEIYDSLENNEENKDVVFGSEQYTVEKLHISETLNGRCL